VSVIPSLIPEALFLTLSNQLSGLSGFSRTFF
jgi:hypothetical protein